MSCVGCEGKPAPENNPCAVCGLTAPSNANTSGLAPTDALRLVQRRAVYDWLRDDVPLNVKMTIMPHHIDALMDRLSKAAPASPLPGGGWQDISTAPRQERVMLGHKDFKGWFCLAICNALGEWSYDDRPWGQQDAPDREATHWMPLPAAPTGDA